MSSAEKIREQRKKDNQDYLKERCDHIIRRLVVDLLKSKPEDVLEYMEKWISKERKKGPSSGQEGGKNSHLEASDHSEDEDDQDAEAILKKKKEAQQGKAGRGGVSAEAYGKYNKKEDFKPRVIPKNDDAKKRIYEKLNKNFMFKNLDGDDKEIVINAMEEKKFKKGDTIIKQGDDGDVLYLVDSGVLSCSKRFPGKQEDTFLLKYKPGDSFGELALLYNAPRAATIVADEDAVLFSCDRATFSNIVKEASMKRRERFEEFLKKIPLLSSLDSYERNKICDVLESEVVADEGVVVKEGEKGDKFYFIEEGQAVAKKMMNGKETVVYEYKPYDYFGELALMKDEPRAATVVAKGKLKINSIDRDTFKRLLGPLDEVLKRNVTNYEKYMKEHGISK